MTPEHFERVSELFERALALTGDERAQFVAALVDEPPGVVAELNSLLVAHEQTGHVLFDRPGDEIAAGLAEASIGLPAPTRIGPWRIERELGRGGMGIVYLARRDDGQFDQQAALKLVRAGIDSDETRARFVFERQLLARLRHPAIATLLDGGIADDGRPYFVLEYIDGEPLFDYCDRHALPLERRLRLFIRICDAVQYAHQSLVVHRDLKPSNILVTDDGEPRLLDFGIAKLLDVDAAAGEVPQTRAGHGLLTPEYGAPEQLSGEPVTTSADVYALGVILYELVSGTRPYEFSNRSAGAFYEALVRTDPLRPSANVVRRAEHAGSAARLRATTIQKLARSLRGDLDVIAMTAMAKQPQRRYPSAGALGDDVRRYLDERPIRARADSAGYRLAKFLRRHTVAASAVVVVALSLVTGLAATVWQARIAAREAVKAESITAFLLEILESADPDLAQGRDLTVRELVDDAVVRLDEAAEDGRLADPVVEATIRSTLGTTLRALGQYDAAVTQFDRALGLSDPGAAWPDAQTLRLHSDLGAAHFDAGRIDAAETHYRIVLDRGPAVVGDEHLLLLETRIRFAGIPFRRGDLAQAERLLRDSATVASRTLGPDHPQTLTARSNLAASVARQGRFDEAAVLLRESLHGLRRQHGDADRLTLVARDNLANIELHLGNFAKSVELNEKNVALRRDLLDANHPAMLESIGRLAGAYHAAGRLDDAKRLFDEVVPATRERLGEHHPNTLLVRGNEALLRADLGEREAALGDLEVVVGAMAESLGADHPLTAAMRDEMLAIVESR